MYLIEDTLGTHHIEFKCIESSADYKEVATFVAKSYWLGIDTESTGINCYKPDWQLRTLQISDGTISYVIPATHKKLIEWIIKQSVHWIGHNGTHDWRCIDQYLGYASGKHCDGETYIPAHYLDARNKKEGGIGHKLEELAIAYVAPEAGKWKTQLNIAFKQIEIPVPGAVYRSGPRKGQPRTRKANLSEGWTLIALDNPVYIAYAAADPLLTYRVWEYLQPTVAKFYELYRFDMAVDRACDALQRRAIRLDVRYTYQLAKEFDNAANIAETATREFGCHNINSTVQLSATLTVLGATLTARTPTGKIKCDDNILRNIADGTGAAAKFARAVLTAKQIRKRQVAYTNAFLTEMDAEQRVHPSINSLAARTARMSVSNPPLQQLPTKDRESDE